MDVLFRAHFARNEVVRYVSRLKLEADLWALEYGKEAAFAAVLHYLLHLKSLYKLSSSVLFLWDRHTSWASLPWVGGDVDGIECEGFEEFRIRCEEVRGAVRRMREVEACVAVVSANGGVASSLARVDGYDPGAVEVAGEWGREHEHDLADSMLESAFQRARVYDDGECDVKAVKRAIRAARRAMVKAERHACANEVLVSKCIGPDGYGYMSPVPTWDVSRYVYPLLASERMFEVQCARYECVALWPHWSDWERMAVFNRVVREVEVAVSELHARSNAI